MCIRDSKPGEAKKVFDRFWRADPSRVRQSGGTGLGLAIATQDAELHGGRLEAWGVPGEGSCFRLTLPREAGHPLTSSPVPLRFPVGDQTEVTEPMATGEIPLSIVADTSEADSDTDASAGDDSATTSPSASPLQGVAEAPVTTADVPSSSSHYTASTAGSTTSSTTSSMTGGTEDDD